MTPWFWDKALLLAVGIVICIENIEFLSSTFLLLDHFLDFDM